MQAKTLYTVSYTHLTNAEQLCLASQYFFFISAMNATASSSEATGRTVAINLDFFSTISPSPPIYTVFIWSTIPPPGSFPFAFHSFQIVTRQLSFLQYESLRNCEECPYFQFFLYSDTVLWYNTLMVNQKRRPTMNYGKKRTRKREHELASKGTMIRKKFNVIFCKALLICFFAVVIVGGCSAFGVISGIIASAPSIEDIDARCV